MWHADCRLLPKIAIQTGHAIGNHVVVRRTKITLIVGIALVLTFAVIVLGVHFVGSRQDFELVRGILPYSETGRLSSFKGLSADRRKFAGPADTDSAPVNFHSL